MKRLWIAAFFGAILAGAAMSEEKQLTWDENRLAAEEASALVIAKAKELLPKDAQGRIGPVMAELGIFLEDGPPPLDPRREDLLIWINAGIRSLLEGDETIIRSRREFWPPLPDWLRERMPFFHLGYSIRPKPHFSISASRADGGIIIIQDLRQKTPAEIWRYKPPHVKYADR